MKRRDEPIYLAKYVRENYLLGTSGWKQLCCYVKNTNNINRLLKSSKGKQHRNTVKIKFGMDIPCDHKDSMIFDANKVNTNWKDSELLELKQIYKFYPFDYLGPVNSARIPTSHTKILKKITIVEVVIRKFTR